MKQNIITYKEKFKATRRLTNIADSIKHYNVDRTHPSEFLDYNYINLDVSTQLAKLFNCEVEKADHVLISCPMGVKPHRDLLSLDKFKVNSIIIPILLPRGETVLQVGSTNTVVSLYSIYQFNHQIVHSLKVEETTGCVFIMAAELI